MVINLIPFRDSNTVCSLAIHGAIDCVCFAWVTFIQGGKPCHLEPRTRWRANCQPELLQTRGVVKFVFCLTIGIKCVWGRCDVAKAGEPWDTRCPDSSNPAKETVAPRGYVG